MLQTLEEVANVLNIEDEVAADPVLEARLTQIIIIASNLLQRKCRRDFDTFTGDRIFDAPAEVYLAVPDLQSISEITTYALPLPPEQYKLYLDVEGIGLNKLMRLAGDYTTTWRYDEPDGVTPRGAIAITGTWGFTEVPDELKTACEMLSSYIYNRRKRQFSPDSGGGVIGRENDRTGSGYWSPEIMDLIRPYVLPEQYQLIVDDLYDDA